MLVGCHKHLALQQNSTFCLIFAYQIKNKMSTAVETLVAPVTFTAGAVKELLKLKDQQELNDDFGLRIGVEGGGCSGMSYVLGFDQQKDGDQIYYIDGIKTFMHKAHGLYL